jgi:hypothetical protein
MMARKELIALFPAAVDLWDLTRACSVHLVVWRYTGATYPRIG